MYGKFELGMKAAHQQNVPKYTYRERYLLWSVWQMTDSPVLAVSSWWSVHMDIYLLQQLALLTKK